MKNFGSGLLPLRPKRKVLVVMTLKGTKYESLAVEKVIGSIFFNETDNLYGVRFIFIYRNPNKKPLRLESLCGMPDPYRHLEHLVGSVMTNLRMLYGGHIKMERFDASAKVRGFNEQFFRLLETHELAV